MAPRDSLLDAEDEAVAMEEEQEEPTVVTTKKGKKMKMGERSGLTEDDRRRLRREQREIAKMLQDGAADEEEEEDYVEVARQKNNDLFCNVRYAREAVLDAENVDSIAAKFSKKVDDIVQVPRFDANQFIHKLKSKITARSASGHTYFDWKVLGTESGVCYNTVPSRVTFMIGPLENVELPEKRKARVVRQKRANIEEEELEEQKPEELASKKQKKNADQLSQAERNLKKMEKVLTKRCEQVAAENKANYDEIKEKDPDSAKIARLQLNERGQEIDFVQFCVNPHSFTQTVENIFNFSFLIKKGEAKITTRKPEPLGSSNENNPLDLPVAGCFVSVGDPEYKNPATQCVIPFTMKDWRRLVASYGLEKCDVPHRKGTKQHKGDPMSQEEECA